MTTSDQAIYELAYHLNSDIEETTVLARSAELAKLLTASGAVVLSDHEAKHKHLSYPIQHKHYAYFGSFELTASPEALEKINAQLKLQPQVLRYLLLRQDLEKKALRSLGGERPRPKLKTHEPTTPAPLIEVKPEQMEKEIEDVLEKI